MRILSLKWKPVATVGTSSMDEVFVFERAGNGVGIGVGSSPPVATTAAIVVALRRRFERNARS